MHIPRLFLVWCVDSEIDSSWSRCLKLKNQMATCEVTQWQQGAQEVLVCSHVVITAGVRKGLFVFHLQSHIASCKEYLYTRIILLLDPCYLSISSHVRQVTINWDSSFLECFSTNILISPSFPFLCVGIGKRILCFIPDFIFSGKDLWA